jgi:hypothetical protein
MSGTHYAPTGDARAELEMQMEIEVAKVMMGL